MSNLYYTGENRYPKFLTHDPGKELWPPSVFGNPPGTGIVRVEYSPAMLKCVSGVRTMEDSIFGNELFPNSVLYVISDSGVRAADRI
jgi:hypothetical protein